ncbi:MAG: PepSY1/2 domain-containing protein [Christensenellales bacterium]
MKRIHKLIAIATAGLLIAGLSVYAIVLHDERNQLKRQVSAIYTRAFEDLLTDVSSLEGKLNKLAVSSGPSQHEMLLVDVWRQAGETEGAISALPVSFSGTEQLTQFVNRAGDYCRALSRKLAFGETLTKGNFDEIKKLADSCRDIYASLDAVWRDGAYPGDTAFLSSVYMETEAQGANIDFANQEFPRLMYDGPFSESTENKRPEGLSGGEVTLEKAARAAAKFLEISSDALSPEGECDGNIPCYNFAAEKDGTRLRIFITKKGGKVLWFMSGHDGGISAVPTDEKYERLSLAAQKFLRDKGYGESAPSYAQFYNGLALINLAPVEKDIVLYPDLIKVWVDIPTETVVGLDANNYLMSHQSRGFDTPELTKEQAREKINGGIKINKTRLALIPLESGAERLCWEFTGSYNGRDYIIYINVKTGVEEDILIILHTNDGTLVM